MIELEIPDALPSYNQFFGRSHYRERVKIVEEWRVKTAIVLYQKYMGQVPRLRYPVRLEVVVEKPRGVLDCSNVCVKVVEDALIRCQVLPDDRPEFVSELRVHSRKGPVKRTCVTLVAVHTEGHADATQR